MKSLLLVAGILLVAAPVELAAQRDDQFVWGVGGGATFPSGYAEDNHDAGAHGLAIFGIGGVDSPFGIRFDGFYSALGDKGSNGLAVDQGDARVFALFGNGVLSLYGSNRKLYLIGGLGGFWYNPDGAGTTAVNDFGLSAGAGVFFPGINAFIEARWMNLYRALPDPVTGQKGKKSARLYPVTLGIMF